MKEEKVKVNLRVGLLIRETLVDEAAVEDIRVGTLAHRLLQSELDKVMACLLYTSVSYPTSSVFICPAAAAAYFCLLFYTPGVLHRK